jgi:hypothetical protein
MVVGHEQPFFEIQAVFSCAYYYGVPAGCLSAGNGGFGNGRAD